MRRVKVTVGGAASVNIGGVIYLTSTTPYTLTVTDAQYNALTNLANSRAILLSNESTYILPANASDAGTAATLANAIKNYLVENEVCRTLHELVATVDYSAPVAGASGKTKILTLSRGRIKGATKWMAKVQAGAFTEPVIDTVYTGAVKYTAGTELVAASTNHLLLLATDDAGKVKGYVDITIGADQVGA